MRKKILLTISAIILLGLFLRFYNISEESLWLDEGATALAVKKYDSQGILENIVEEGQILPEYYPQYNDDLPAYNVILNIWGSIFGVDELSLRVFSAILGSLSLILIFYLSNYLFNEKVALITTLLSSLNLTLIFYSQEVRQYSYLLLLSLLSLIFLLKLTKERNIKYAFGLVIANVFIIYSHFPWAIFIFFEGVYALYVLFNEYSSNKTLNKKLIVAFIVLGLLYTPIIDRAITTETNTLQIFGKPEIFQISKFGLQLSTWLYPSTPMKEKLNNFEFDFSFFGWLLLLSVILAGLSYGILFLYGLASSFELNDSYTFASLMFFGPIIFSFVLSWVHPIVSLFQIKLLIYIIPFYLIFISIAILRTKFVVPLIFVLILINVLPINAYYTNINKGQFREAAQFLPDDEKIFVNIFTAQAAFQYYYGEKPNVIGIRSAEDLKKHLINENSFWVLLTFTKYSDSKESIKAYLDENYEIVEQKNDFFDIKLIHYKQKEN